MCKDAKFKTNRRLATQISGKGDLPHLSVLTLARLNHHSSERR